MLASLEDEGLIEKRDDPNDGRGKLIFLTQEGKDMQNTVERKGQQMEEILLTDCSSAEIKIAKKVLAEMYEKLYLSANSNSPLHIDDSKCNVEIDVDK